MNKGLIIASALAVVALGSCTTVNNDPLTTVTPEAMVVNMTVADITVKPEKVTATHSWNWNPFKTVKGAKASAEAAALKEANADVLVEPQYEVVRRGIFRGGSVTVTGYPAIYTNFRPMTMTDAVIINTLGGGAAATPVIETSAPSLIDKLKPEKQRKPKAPKPAPDNNFNRNYLDLTFGFPGGHHTADFALGVQYSRMKTRNWGWFLQGDVAFHGEWTGCDIMAGAVRSLPCNFKVFAGAGIGVTSRSCDQRGCVPVEVGVKYSFSMINLMVGYKAQITKETISTPFFGVGFNF